MPAELMTPEELAVRLKSSRTHIFEMRRAGRLPKEMELSPKKCFWFTREIEDWIAAGMPVRAEWERRKQEAVV